MSIDLFDVVLSAALIGSLIQGAVLMRKVRRLQAALLELGPAIQAFSRDVDRSELSVADFRAAQQQEAERSRVSEPAGSARSSLREPARPTSLIDRFYQVTRQKGNA